MQKHYQLRVWKQWNQRSNALPIVVRFKFNSTYSCNCVHRWVNWVMCMAIISAGWKFKAPMILEYFFFPSHTELFLYFFFSCFPFHEGFFAGILSSWNWNYVRYRRYARYVKLQARVVTKYRANFKGEFVAAILNLNVQVTRLYILLSFVLSSTA